MRDFISVFSFSLFFNSVAEISLAHSVSAKAFKPVRLACNKNFKRTSTTDIVNYNTKSNASVFLGFFLQHSRQPLSVSETMVCKTQQLQIAIVPYTISGLDERDVWRICNGAWIVWEKADRDQRCTPDAHGKLFRRAFGRNPSRHPSGTSTGLDVAGESASTRCLLRK
ncbi:MAG: hypothetical protein ABSD76_06955 [Terriglobales bacterium]